ncbi:MAG: ketoacyl-ACP synthase III [Gammaproteobacteria bacterium]|jgi:3-oxoacyl-[acyl-carrier-protein] synthase-3|nr:ketoacyl-ACP synthase III [Gammaproteobacteria bacterium]MDH3846921.1 ketoacyl-ACP synthase III [Gammaproteobacteria bacterium]MDH3862562.1 ketoacyl-ACP synthase III [Gammaproteobacteria bacterium]MDH3906032.1 ketoacyl-ACP synthase III [Gammaproteobacteria bacterium]MDH3953326.1 ketoacyl-ACP synthase III [Gammaproteobacteria bacterium]
MTYSRIAGTGSYLPEKVVTNSDLEKVMDTSDEWIQERTGIKRRHIAADDQATSDLALAAANEALDMAGLAAEDIDLIIIATTTPDKVFPGTACIVQRRLGIRGCGAFDIQAACSGFVYGLDLADRHIRTGGGKNVLVIGAETLSRLTNWEDRTTAVLFGDGAGAVVLQETDEPGIISTHIHADGQYEDLLQVPQGVSQGYDITRAGEAFIQMNGNAVFRRAVATLDSIARETLDKNNIDKHDLDWFVPHQANMRIITAAAKKLDMPMERVIVTVDEHANTSAASIPLAFDVAVRDGRIKRGELLLFEAFGAGFTWGSTLLRF